MAEFHKTGLAEWLRREEALAAEVANRLNAIVADEEGDSANNAVSKERLIRTLGAMQERLQALEHFIAKIRGEFFKREMG